MKKEKPKNLENLQDCVALIHFPQLTSPHGGPVKSVDLDGMRIMLCENHADELKPRVDNIIFRRERGENT